MSLISLARVVHKCLFLPYRTIGVMARNTERDATRTLISEEPEWAERARVTCGIRRNMRTRKEMLETVSRRAESTIALLWLVEAICCCS